MIAAADQAGADEQVGTVTSSLAVLRGSVFMRMVVTGASGKLGRLVVAALLGRVPASELILVSRSPDSLEDFARRGATVRYGDFERPDSLSAAFAGGQRALVISTIGVQDTPAAHRAAFEEAVRSGVQHIVYTSVPNPVEDNPFPPARVHLHSEQDLRATGIAWTILRNALYAELRSRIATKYIRDGRWTTNTGNGSHAFVARTDCAAAAAAALTGDGHEGRVYDITGPELVDAEQYVALLEEFGGHPIVRIEVNDAEYERYRAGFSADPNNAAYFELFAGTGEAIRAGYLNQVGTGVQHLTSRLPLSLREVFGRG
jgi:NAD(P)H dehydrogenase (quinone)